MYLTREEEELLNKPGCDVCMKLLLSVGRVFDAKRMVKVHSVHISGISYQNIGEAGLEWIENLSKIVKFRISATVNPAGMDLRRWKEMNIDEEFYHKQLRILRALKKMGARLEMCCTPYYFNEVGYGDTLAWAESNAVVYANSILGARTNRESGITAIASAVTGLTPEYGMHLKENRVPDIKVKIDLSEGDAAIAGCEIGRLECNLPYIVSKKKLEESEMKAMGAAMAATGGKTMFHVENQTPEWNIYSKPEEKVAIGRKELREAREENFPTEVPDIVAIGCPHASSMEILKIAEFARYKFVIPVWVFTCRRNLTNSTVKLAVEKIEKAGGKVFCDTCMVVSPATERFSKVMVDSGKALTYLPKLRGVKAFFGSLKECMEVATGRLVI
jgi:predicted aconitase